MVFKWKHFNCMLLADVIIKKQGSSEKDGRSDVYDRLELNSFLTAVTTTAVAPIVFT